MYLTIVTTFLAGTKGERAAYACSGAASIA
jgi:hypothetical protein